MSLPEQKFDESVWHILKKIKEKSLYADTEKRVPYFIITEFDDWSDNPPLPRDELGILRRLRRQGIIKLTDPNSIDLLSPDLYIEIIHPAFDQLYKFHRIFTDKHRAIKTSEIREIKIGGKKEKIKSITELYLNNIGDFWRNPKDKYCYKMEEKSARCKIIRYLATNNGYQQTSEISFALENKSEQSIRTEIAKIRSNIKKFLKIDGKKVIESKKDSGYRIGKKYKIKIKKQ
jgi:hypothetical protein